MGRLLLLSEALSPCYAVNLSRSYYFAEVLHERLDDSVCLRVVRGDATMFEAELFAEVLELVAVERWAVVRSDNLRGAEEREYAFEALAGDFRRRPADHLDDWEA